MNLRPSVTIASAALLATSLILPAQTSTPDQRNHWAEVTHKFETAPLDEIANREAEAAVQEITNAHNFHVVLCPRFLNELKDSSYTYHAEIFRLYTLAAATYQVETNKNDAEGTSLYAFHSLLKGYAAILRQHPDTKDKELAEMAELDAVGQLPHLIERKGCM